MIPIRSAELVGRGGRHGDLLKNEVPFHYALSRFPTPSISHSGLFRGGLPRPDAGTSMFRRGICMFRPGTRMFRLQLPPFRPGTGMPGFGSRLPRVRMSRFQAGTGGFLPLFYSFAVGTCSFLVGTCRFHTQFYAFARMRRAPRAEAGSRGMKVFKFPLPLCASHCADVCLRNRPTARALPGGQRSPLLPCLAMTEHRAPGACKVTHRQVQKPKITSNGRQPPEG
ncbi:MAG: hypothetical protein JWO81_3492 [Alphaproteobacteria bacterium]|nr:hypothetical protein [Alphaproteobacteria bacterium]